MGYRYFDSVGKRALYPFGFGLSYTTFVLGTQKVQLEGTKVTAEVCVTNTGKHSGKETVQVYVSAPAGKLDKPYQDLAAFAKSAALKPNGSDTVTVTFDLRDLASFDESRSADILEPGKYIIRVGNSSVNTHVAAVIELDELVVTRQVKACCGEPGFVDWKPESAAQEEIPGHVPVLKLEASTVETQIVSYEHEYEIDEAVKALTDEQLAYSNVGGFDPKGGIASIIGNASRTVSGAAGESTAMLKNQGFKSIVMADGPAGLRLTPEFYRDEKGAHGIGGTGLPESMLEMLPGFAQ